MTTKAKTYKMIMEGLDALQDEFPPKEVHVFEHFDEQVAAENIRGMVSRILGFCEVSDLRLSDLILEMLVLRDVRVRAEQAEARFKKRGQGDGSYSGA